MNFSDALQLAQAMGLEWPSPAWIFGCLLFSLLGIAAWRYGRTLEVPRIRWLGLALMLYGYVTDATWALYAVGLALCAAIWWSWPRRAPETPPRHAPETPSRLEVASRNVGPAASVRPELDLRPHADALADCALAVLAQRFPHKLDHLILDESDRALPAQMHPVFDGCFDWHSSVHMHWSLLRLRALAPALANAGAIARRFDAHLRPELVARELDYLRTPGRGSFERPYGWAWLLKLQSELYVQADQDGATASWAAALRPLADEVARRLAAFVRQGRYPVRAGTHANSAFALLLARDYAVVVADRPLLDAIDAAAVAWFGRDAAYPAAYEPSGTDFLSPGLCEAVLMQRVLGADFAPWWTRFAPGDEALGRWDTPAVVADRTDGHLVHLDGLNLSRAWCLRALAGAGGVPAPVRERFARAAQAHWQAAWPHVTGGDFVATHWLVSFALLAGGL